MKKAPIPVNEDQRQEELDSYNVLDTDAEMVFDEITELAATICDTKISLVSLIDRDRQWFKSRFGLEAQETPRDISYCGHAIMSDDVFIVEDSALNEDFCDNPLYLEEPNVTFYAGAPLITPSGNRIGTLCVIHDEPKKLTDLQIKTLQLLAKNVVNLLELKLKNEVAAIGAMAVTYNHKINNPLMIAVAQLKKIEKNYGQHEEVNLLRKSLDDIRNTVQKINELAESEKVSFEQYCNQQKMVQIK